MNVIAPAEPDEGLDEALARIKADYEEWSDTRIVSLHPEQRAADIWFALEAEVRSARDLRPNSATACAVAIRIAALCLRICIEANGHD